MYDIKSPRWIFITILPFTINIISGEILLIYDVYMPHIVMLLYNQHVLKMCQNNLLAVFCNHIFLFYKCI